MISVIPRLTGQSYAPNGASGRYGLLTSHPSRVWPADSRSFAGLHVRLAEYWRKMEESNPYRYQHHRVQTGSPTSERHLPETKRPALASLSNHYVKSFPTKHYCNTWKRIAITRFFLHSLDRNRLICFNIRIP